MKNPLHILDLGLRPYGPVLELQRRLAGQRRAGDVPDTLILVEHEPVYTLGRGADESHITASGAERAQWGVRVFRIERGGDVTYHGPGQLVGYPILHLGDAVKRAVEYVGRLETLLIRVLADFGIEAGRDPKNRGVWVGGDKIAAIGVRIAGRVTLHGFALNVRTDLAPYRGIIPCGIRDRGVTSMHLRRPDVAVEDVKAKLVERFCEGFGYRAADVTRTRESAGPPVGGAGEPD